ncbi:HIG1 domain-containing protein mitochondrial [Taenia solium]|uniref:Huntingtin interacting protein 1 n=1 Tax=Taenia solium TaxID=6204 RepID=A0A0N9DUD9_TAESO|nr:huntingtin interacting protein 1 [Taenia solium]|eukprot:TsM_000768800 transcript=TsM_000768800 gene=TsM_000768800
MSEKSEMQHHTGSSNARSPNRIERFKTLMIENPLVPLGIIFTGAVLINGARTMRTSASSMQKMMRWRIYGQGASLALLAYLSLKVHKSYKGKYMQDSSDE